MLRIPIGQLTNHMKLNKKEGPSVYTSIPLRKGNKIVIGGRGREGPGWERERRRKRGGSRIKYGGRQERSPDGQVNE